MSLQPSDAGGREGVTQLRRSLQELDLEPCVDSAKSNANIKLTFVHHRIDGVSSRCGARQYDRRCIEAALRSAKLPTDLELSSIELIITRRRPGPPVTFGSVLVQEKHYAFASNGSRVFEDCAGPPL